MICTDLFIGSECMLKPKTFRPKVQLVEVQMTARVQMSFFFTNNNYLFMSLETHVAMAAMKSNTPPQVGEEDDTPN